MKHGNKTISEPILVPDNFTHSQESPGEEVVRSPKEPHLVEEACQEQGHASDCTLICHIKKQNNSASDTKQVMQEIVHSSIT